MTIWILPSLLGMLTSLSAARYASAQMRPPASHYMMAMALMVGWWCLTQWTSLLWINQEYRYFLGKLQYIAVCSVPVLWLCTALSFGGYNRFLSRWYAALWAVPLVTLIIAFTNDFHFLLWQQYDITPGDIRLNIQYGPWFDVHTTYSYASVLIGTVIMAQRIGLSRLYRTQLLAAVLAPIMVLGINLPFIMGQQWLPIDPTPTGFAIAALMITLAIRQNLFSVVPVARRNTIDNISDAVIVIDDQARIADANSAARSMLGISGTRVGTLITDSLPKGTRLRTNTVQDVALRDGRWVDMRITPVKALDGHTLGQVILLRDVTAERELRGRLMRAQQALQALNQRLNVMAHTDELTDLANRRRLYESLREEWSRSARHQQPLSIILLDFDHFKSINDDFGHQTGDAVLSKAARELLRITRPEDLVARHGGEELAVLLPQTDMDAAIEAAQRIRQAIAAMEFLSDTQQKISVTVSLGVANRQPEDDSPDALIARADQALYHSKNTGRNGVSIHQHDKCERI